MCTFMFADILWLEITTMWKITPGDVASTWVSPYLSVVCDMKVLLTLLSERRNSSLENKEENLLSDQEEERTPPIINNVPKSNYSS